jgi:hypothetical protein
MNKASSTTSKRFIIGTSSLEMDADKATGNRLAAPGLPAF